VVNDVTVFGDKTDDTAHLLFRIPHCIAKISDPDLREGGINNFIDAANKLRGIGSRVTLENVAGLSVEMVQETDYPWNGRVALTVNPAQPKRFSVRVRVPDRDVSELYTATPDADGIHSISVNGSSIKPKIEKGYAVITRSWKTGDKIELELPMDVQRVKGSDMIDATKGKVALRYGPLVYNVERVDQDITQPLPASASLNTEWRIDLLDGVRVIKGQWADGSPLLAIPNYARNNRDDESTTDGRDSGGPDTVASGDGEDAGNVESGRRRGWRGPSSIVWINEGPRE
jgi:uncharacterized protein